MESEPRNRFEPGQPLQRHRRHTFETGHGLTHACTGVQPATASACPACPAADPPGVDLECFDEDGTFAVMVDGIDVVLIIVERANNTGCGAVLRRSRLERTRCRRERRHSTRSGAARIMTAATRLRETNVSMSGQPSSMPCWTVWRDSRLGRDHAGRQGNHQGKRTA